MSFDLSFSVSSRPKESHPFFFALSAFFCIPAARSQPIAVGKDAYMQSERAGEGCLSCNGFLIQTILAPVPSYHIAETRFVPTGTCLLISTLSFSVTAACTMLLRCVYVPAQVRVGGGRNDGAYTSIHDVNACGRQTLQVVRRGWTYPWKLSICPLGASTRSAARPCATGTGGACYDRLSLPRRQENVSN